MQCIELSKRWNTYLFRVSSPDTDFCRDLKITISTCYILSKAPPIPLERLHSSTNVNTLQLFLTITFSPFHFLYSPDNVNTCRR